MGMSKEIVCHMWLFSLGLPYLPRCSGSLGCNVHISEPSSSAWTQQQAVLRCHGAVCFPPPARTKWEVELYLNKERVEGQCRCPRAPHTCQVPEEQSTRTFRDSSRTFSSPAWWEEARAKPGNTGSLPPGEPHLQPVSRELWEHTHTHTHVHRHTLNKHTLN